MSNAKWQPNAGPARRSTWCRSLFRGLIAIHPPPPGRVSHRYEIGSRDLETIPRCVDTRLTGETKRKFSVAYVVRPRTRTTNACLCFTLMSKMPDGKPWSRAADKQDPSRGVLLDLQEDCDWKMDSTVLIPNIDPITALDDNMQVQCLPVCGSDQTKWTYLKVLKVTAFRTFAKLPSWCGKPKDFAYRLCTENMTKTAIAPALPEEDRKALLEHCMLPPESSASNRFCVMCPVKRGSPRLPPMLLMS